MNDNMVDDATDPHDFNYNEIDNYYKPSPAVYYESAAKINTHPGRQILNDNLEGDWNDEIKIDNSIEADFNENEQKNVQKRKSIDKKSRNNRYMRNILSE